MNDLRVVQTQVGNPVGCRASSSKPQASYPCERRNAHNQIDRVGGTGSSETDCVQDEPEEWS
jgi:hypothetical protein